MTTENMHEIGNIIPYCPRRIIDLAVDLEPSTLSETALVDLECTTACAGALELTYPMVKRRLFARRIIACTAAYCPEEFPGLEQW